MISMSSSRANLRQKMNINFTYWKNYTIFISLNKLFLFKLSF